jgi:hypothetical protein
MGALLAALWTALGGSLTALFGGWKTVILVTLLAFGAIAAYNLVVDIVEECFNFALASIGGVGTSGLGSGVVQIAGLGAYLASHMRIPECIAFIVNITILKWIVAKIPFIKW